MKTKFTTITMFVLIILGFTANAEQKKSEIRKLDFLKLKKAAITNGINSSQFKQLFIAENQLSVPRFSEDYTWDEDLNDWLHDSNTTYTYNNVGRLTEEIARKPETDIYLTRNSYSDLNYFKYEVSYVWGVDEWLAVAGERSGYTISAESQINGAIEQSIENGIWVNKTRVEYILDQYNIPTQLRTYHWNGNDWSLYSRAGLLTWADWPNRELAAYTLQYMQENNWVNAERYSTQYDGDKYTATTEIWDNGQWVNSTRKTYSRTETREEIILENWTAQGWEKTEKYQGTFDYYGNPTGMYYSSWNGTDWDLETELFFDLKFNESNDVTEMVFRYRDPELSEPVNMSKSVFSNFLHFTTDVPEISVLNNVKVFPNPVKNALNISISDASIKSYQVNITDLAGKAIYQNTFSSSSATVNTERFIRGMYVLSIKTADGRSHQTKIFKQ